MSDIAELVAKILRAMGLNEEILPVAIIEEYIKLWQEIYPDNECLVLYNVIKSLYNYLIQQAAIHDVGQGKTYEKEKEGDVEITLELNKYNKAEVWKEALANFLKNPWDLLPECKVEFAKSTPPVIVGGVNETKIEQVNTNTNNRTGGASERGGVNNPLAGARTVPKGWNLQRPWGSGNWRNRN